MNAYKILNELNAVVKTAVVDDNIDLIRMEMVVDTLLRSKHYDGTELLECIALRLSQGPSALPLLVTEVEEFYQIRCAVPAVR